MEKKKVKRVPEKHESNKKKFEEPKVVKHKPLKEITGYTGGSGYYIYYLY
jgi:hypothetical protein